MSKVTRRGSRALAVRLTVWVVATMLTLAGMHVSTGNAAHDEQPVAAAPVQATLRLTDDAPATGMSVSFGRVLTVKPLRHAKPRTPRHHRLTPRKRHRTATRHNARHRTAGHRGAEKHGAAPIGARVLATVAPSGGRDISWPQCPRNVGIPGRHGFGLPLPDPGVRFVLVGLTNGRSFTRNPCLERHLEWVRTHHVWAAAYAFATYPTRPQLRRFRHSGPFDGNVFIGKLRNAGYASARYNIRTLQHSGFAAPHVWLDVEPSSSRPWSGRPDWNRGVVEGWVRAYRDAGYTTGFYSVASMWREILGGWRPAAPEWRTSGPASPAAALRACTGASFQGGRAVVSQWWTSRVDYDRVCPRYASDREMAHWFHRY